VGGEEKRRPRRESRRFSLSLIKKKWAVTSVRGVHGVWGSQQEKNVGSKREATPQTGRQLTLGEEAKFGFERALSLSVRALGGSGERKCRSIRKVNYYCTVVKAQHDSPNRKAVYTSEGKGL